MSTVAEITQAIPRLNNSELREVEEAILRTYRDRKVGIIFDDAYGTFTDQDLAAIQDEALRIIDGVPQPHLRHPDSSEDSACWKLNNSARSKQR
jgi:hypothetical protein